MLANTILVSKKHECFVSPEDWEFASSYNWFLCARAAYRNLPRDGSGVRHRAAMHREIMARVHGRQLTKDEVVDHMDRNPMNNKRSNLRLCNNGENQWNRGRQAGKELYKGVFKNVNRKFNPYLAAIGYKNMRINLGSYATPEEAHAAYRAAAILLHKGFARFD